MEEQMSFKRSVKGISLNENNYITVAGTYRLEIKSIKQDGYDGNAEPIPKVLFSALKIDSKDGKPFLNEETSYIIEDKYPGTENLLWKSKMLQVATGVPENFDFKDLKGRFALATIGLREHNGKNYAQIKGLTYSKMNDKLPKIEEVVTVVEAEDISADDIPF